MRVIVGAVPGKLHPSVIPAILESGYKAEVFDVSKWDEEYYAVLREVWAAGETFATVEHDITVAPGMLDDLRDCPGLWCAHSYRIYWGDLMDTYHGSAGLGLAKFDRRLMELHPNLFEDDIPSSTYANGRDGRFWMNLDGTISQWLKGPYRHIVHRHEPDVTHQHVYEYEGAWVPPEVAERLPAGHPLAKLPLSPPSEIGSAT